MKLSGVVSAEGSRGTSGRGSPAAPKHHRGSSAGRSVRAFGKQHSYPQSAPQTPLRTILRRGSDTIRSSITRVRRITLPSLWQQAGRLKRTL